jgi:hypothetical protein
LAEPLRFAEKLHDLLQVAFSRLQAGDIAERDVDRQVPFVLATLVLQNPSHRSAAGHHHLLRAVSEPEDATDDQYPGEHGE